MRGCLITGFVVSVSLFSAVAAWRLSTDALALVIGILVGVLILLPTNAILFFYVRSQSRNDSAQRQDSAYTAPPVVIVQSPPPTLPHPAHRAALPSPQPPLPWDADYGGREHERVWVQRVFGGDDIAHYANGEPPNRIAY
ncbi:MAG: hypothetical protein J5I90_19325 [Caldilineales bacterium]|nr:hypothetical protein [Caldilineales bacterium]